MIRWGRIGVLLLAIAPLAASSDDAPRVVMAQPAAAADRRLLCV